MGKVIKGNLTAKQELFCHLFAKDRDCFGNGTQSYIKAYKKKITYKTARTEAYKLLTNPDITNRIRALLDIWISEEVVDKETAMVILQYADLPSKVAAIREYNRVRGRLAPQKIKFIDENEDIDEEKIDEEIARRKKHGEFGKKFGDKKIKKSP